MYTGQYGKTRVTRKSGWILNILVVSKGTQIVHRDFAGTWGMARVDFMVARKILPIKNITSLITKYFLLRFVFFSGGQSSFEKTYIDIDCGSSKKCVKFKIIIHS